MGSFISRLLLRTHATTNILRGTRGLGVPVPWSSREEEKIYLVFYEREKGST